MFLVAHGTLTDEAGSLSSLLTEAGRTLSSLDLVILPECLLDPVLGESRGDMEEAKALAFPFPCTKGPDPGLRMPGSTANTWWHWAAQPQRSGPLRGDPWRPAGHQLSHCWVYVVHKGWDKTALRSRAAGKSAGHPVRCDSR